MFKKQNSQYAMLVQTRDFGIAYSDKCPEGSEIAKAFAVVTTAVATIDGFINARMTAPRVSSTSKRAARMGVIEDIVTIARTVRVLAKATPGAEEKFPLPTRKGDLTVLQTGRLYLQEAAAVKDSLIRGGLPSTFVEDLQQSVATLEKAIGARSAGRSGQAVARDHIRTALKQGMDAVRSLDVLVRNVLGHDSVAMSRWKKDRKVDMTGKGASVGAPSHEPASLGVGQPPVAPVASDGAAAPSPAADVGTDPMRRAS